MNSTHPLRVIRERLHLSIDGLADKTGLSRRTILRAEQNEPLNPDSVRLLCDYLQMSADDLGLQIRRSSSKPQENFYSSIALSTNERDDMKRREMLQLLSVTSSALMLPLNVDWDRLSRTLITQSLPIDEATLQDCAEINRQYWQTFHTISQKSLMIESVLQHIQRLVKILQNKSLNTIQHQHLCSIIADIAQMAGEICFDANKYADAVQCYTFAATTAKEAKNYDLWACSLVRSSFTCIFEQQYEQALPSLEMARQLTLHGNSIMATKHWIAAVSADAYAGIGNLDACQNALDIAEGVWELKDASNGGWLRFDGTRLAEQRGSCLVKLQRPDLAIPVLKEALVQLPAPIRRRGLVLNDLALASVQNNDIEQAYTYGIEAIEIAQRGSGALKKSLQTLQTKLKPYTSVGSAKKLIKEIQAIH